MKRLLLLGLLALPLAACGGSDGPCTMTDEGRVCGEAAVEYCTGALEGQAWIEKNLGSRYSKDNDACKQVLAEAGG